MEKGDHLGGFTIVQMPDDQGQDQGAGSRDGENRMDSIFGWEGEEQKEVKGMPRFLLWATGLRA